LLVPIAFVAYGVAIYAVFAVSPVAVAVIGDVKVVSENVATTIKGADARDRFHPVAVIVDPPSLVYVPERVTYDDHIFDVVDVPAHPITGVVVPETVLVMIYGSAVVPVPVTVTFVPAVTFVSDPS
jgi:hypothetical protein